MDGLKRRIAGATLERVRIVSPFLVRSIEPPIEAAEQRIVTEARRLGKRIVLGLGEDFYLVFHLMIAGRFQWKPPGAKPPGRITLATFSFPTGTLILTEAGRKKRASLHLVKGEAALAAHDPGGLEILEADTEAFGTALRVENHTVKRALTDPRLFSGIGNAYSDEILHAARISPLKQTQRLTDDEVERLHAAATQTLQHWTDLLCQEFAKRFPGPGDITAFRDGFAVHGRFGQPCPVCRSAVQRIRYAENETDYCPECQTGGRILADRSLSRLLKDDWPKATD